MPNLLHPAALVGVLLSVCLSAGLWWQGQRVGYAAGLMECRSAAAAPETVPLVPSGPTLPMTGGRRH